MKVVLDLPDWVDERNLRLTAGVELVAVKAHNHDYWRVKDERCNMCGDCCTGLKNHIYPTVNGDCIHLKSPDGKGRRFCAIPLYRSRLCDNDPKQGKYERCSITYKKVKQK
jgi:MinD superfamily P-loop ATPase